MRDKGLVAVNGAEICFETFGDPGDPSILLIMGAAASMDWWPDGFCERLAAGSRHVIRYDLRDTGESTSYPPGEPAYNGTDLIEDVVELLDVLVIPRAHVVGLSMGGSIAQHLAFQYPERTASLTLISTTLAGSSDVELPAMSEELRIAFSEPSPTPDWRDRAAVMEYLVADTRRYQGSVRVGEADLLDLVGRTLDRSHDIAATMTNHWTLEPGDTPEPQLDQIAVPTLVLHGTEDPLFPYGHGEALARAIRGARLVPLPGVGHGELPLPVWELAVREILSITAAGTT